MGPRSFTRWFFVTPITEWSRSDPCRSDPCRRHRTKSKSFDQVQLLKVVSDRSRYSPNPRWSGSCRAHQTNSKWSHRKKFLECTVLMIEIVWCRTSTLTTCVSTRVARGSADISRVSEPNRRTSSIKSPVLQLQNIWATFYEPSEMHQGHLWPEMDERYIFWETPATTKLAHAVQSVYGCGHRFCCACDDFYAMRVRPRGT